MDFFLTNRRSVLINEVKYDARIYSVQHVPTVLWKHTDVSYPELIERLIQLGSERYEEKQSIVHTFE